MFPDPCIHRFAKCDLLERKIETLNENGNVDNILYKNYRKYHFSLVYKLKSAYQNWLDLKEFLTTSETTEVLANRNEHFFMVNHHFDGFLYAIGSALDISAREVLTYYNVPLTGNIYFSSAKTLLPVRGQRTALFAKLDDPGWKSEFSDYRNTQTHELLICTSANVEIDMHAGDEMYVKFPLPDNPRADDRTYRNNPDVLIYTENTLKRVISLINQIYSCLCVNIDNNGSLPL